MGVLPVPEEVRDMANDIRLMAKNIQDQNKLLEKIQAEMAELKAAVGKNEIGLKLDGIHGTLTTAKDALRLMSSLMERKL